MFYIGPQTSTEELRSRYIHNGTSWWRILFRLPFLPCRTSLSYWCFLESPPKEPTCIWNHVSEFLLLGKSQTKAAGTRDDPTRWNTQDGIPDWIIHRPDGNKEGCNCEESAILSFLDNPVRLPHHHSSTHTHPPTQWDLWTREQNIYSQSICAGSPHYSSLQVDGERARYICKCEPWNRETQSWYMMRAHLCPLSVWFG